MRIMRILSICMILLVCSMPIFAGFNGKVSSGFDFNLDTLDYNFANSSSGDLTFDLYGNTIVKEGRGKIYAEAKAMLGIAYNKSFTVANDGTYTLPFTGASLSFRMDYARLIGPGWELGLLAVPGVPDYAKSPIDYKKNSDGTISNSSVTRTSNKAPGGYFEYHDYRVGLGIDGGKDGVHYTVFFESPKYLFGKSMFRVGAYIDGDTSNDKYPYFGLSGKYSYSGNDIVASIASDFDCKITDSNEKVSMQLNFDAVASLYVNFIGFDVFYGTESIAYDLPSPANVLHLLSSRITSDLDMFNLPMRITFTAKDIIARQNMNLAVGYALNKNILLEVNGGYIIASNGRNGKEIQKFDSTTKREGQWSMGVGFQYSDSTLLDAKANMTVSQVVNSNAKLGLEFDISSGALVSGAVFRLKWNTEDILANENNLGNARLSCEIKF